MIDAPADVGWTTQSVQRGRVPRISLLVGDHSLCTFPSAPRHTANWRPCPRPRSRWEWAARIWARPSSLWKGKREIERAWISKASQLVADVYVVGGDGDIMPSGKGGREEFLASCGDSVIVSPLAVFQLSECEQGCRPSASAPGVGYGNPCPRSGFLQDNFY